MQELQLFKGQKMSIHLYCCSHVGGQKNAHQPIFPYSIIKSSLTSLANSSVFNGSNYFKFGTEVCYVVLQAITKFRGIEHNLRG